MRLVVCGCSWSSKDPKYPDTEYGSLLAKKLGASEYINLARPSASNLLIRIQVEYAVKHLSPDLIIAVWTTPERLTWKKRGAKRDYDFLKGLEDVCYYDDDERESQIKHPLESHNDIITAESWYNIISTISFGIPRKFLTAEDKDLLKRFFLQYVDRELLMHQDKFLIESAVTEMTRANIPFLISPGPYYIVDKRTASLYNFVPEQNLLETHPGELTNILTLKELSSIREPVYHTHPKHQRLYVLDYLYPKIQNIIGDTQ